MVPLGVPVEPDEYAQKQTSSLVVGAGANVVAALAVSALQVQMTARVLARDDHMLEERQAFQHRCQGRQDLLGDHQRARAAVFEHELVVGGREQRVHRDGHNAGLDCTQEHAGKVDRVEMAQQDATLHLQAEAGQRIGGAVHPLSEIGVGVAAGVVDVGELVGATGEQIALDQVVRSVVVARDTNEGRADAVVSRAQA